MLEDKPFNDVTVDELAREAGLSRTAFYFYYKDKNEVLGAVLEGVAGWAHGQAADWWSGEGAPDVMIRETLANIGSIYQTHSGVLRAAVEVSAYDPEFLRVYKGLMDNFIAATQEHLHRELQAGRLRDGADPDRHAEVLIWMGERCQYVGMLDGRPPEETARTLTDIWLHALYPDDAFAR
jgi:AcrR family transcriptional regulator